MNQKEVAVQKKTNDFMQIMMTQQRPRQTQELIMIILSSGICKLRMLRFLCTKQ